ncbi:MAG: glycosyltransferase [Opitutaceae bacterium]|jgi:glycosyltransferase involved in cell wall biosynthesis
MSALIPDLTLLIPTAGRTRYLPELFASLELRGDESLEIMVGYHGCEETAGRWLAALPLPADQVRTYAIPAGGGIPANWNAGLERAHGRYLFIMGDDDVFAPGGPALMLAAATCGRGDILAFERDIIDAESRPLPEITREHGAYLKGRSQGLQRVGMANAFPAPPFMSSLYRTEWLSGLGFRGEAGGAADLDLFLRAAAVGYDLDVCAGRPIRYRVHAGSYTESAPLVNQALAVMEWNAARLPAWRDSEGFRREEAWLWRGEINSRLRAGRFAEVREILRHKGGRLSWHVRARLTLKAVLGIREWRPQRFRTEDGRPET